MNKKKRYCKERNDCKSYNLEWQIGACSIYPYQKQRKTEVKEKEVHDTG